ncbi:DNA ligase [Shewanella sp. Isolate8]|uniref:DNA ligase n=1 Tax=Shewanella sp. Isolate8 TaxID=2908529 RepID=UPI001EFD4555|nr:DNA ligase [Shewanella sp. Isolate8]MCG9746107.1 DNA ligase [Shewanella sp. Isolate8]
MLCHNRSIAVGSIVLFLSWLSSVALAAEISEQPNFDNPDKSTNLASPTSPTSPTNPAKSPDTVGFLVVEANQLRSKRPKLTRRQLPDLQLAGSLEADRPISEYLVSEKFDGVRGRWTGTRMLTRSGQPINLPAWFTKGFPTDPLDGELWIGRQQFEAISALVRDKDADPARWRTVQFMVFDYPAIDSPFGERYALAVKRYANLSPFLQIIPQWHIQDRQRLNATLGEWVAQGAEGLMLHHQDAHYHGGRNSDLVKLKRYQDAEAKVIAYLAGKGKYQGMMGALEVETPEGIRFKLGTGFTDEQRRHPPAIGSMVTYKYYGLTHNGVPRFASFLRQREPL